MALAEMGLGLNGIGRNGSWPKWHWPKWLLAKLGIGSSGVGREGIGRNGFGRSGNRPEIHSCIFSDRAALWPSAWASIVIHWTIARVTVQALKPRTVKWNSVKVYESRRHKAIVLTEQYWLKIMDQSQLAWNDLDWKISMLMGLLLYGLLKKKKKCRCRLLFTGSVQI